MSFYTFDQNNSGGEFIIDRQAGIAPYVIIEADSPKEANEKAEEIGLYFDGGGDCPCCGNRWSEVSSYDGKESPKVYGQPADNYKTNLRWGPTGYEIAVHYKDGRVDSFGVKGPGE